MGISREHLKKLIVSLALVVVAGSAYLRHRSIEASGVFYWFDRPVMMVVAPTVHAVTFARDYVVQTFQRYFYLVDVERQNETLRAENARLKERDVVLRDLERENKRLVAALNLRGQISDEGIAARVTGYPLIAPYRIMTIDKGSNDGIRRRAPVISAEGLVGQVSRVFPGYSQVLLITDPTSAVDGRLEPSGARGLVVGKTLSLAFNRDVYISAFEYLSQSTDIKEGARVATSGMDGVYPPGIPIGWVHTQEKKDYDIFQRAEVIPAVDFFKIREVLVLP